jgi:hypothetical protein
MAFTLSLATPTESNDALIIVLTDNSTTWGTTYSYPNGTTSTFSLDITIETFNGSTTFDTITSATFFNNYNPLLTTFSLTGSLLTVGGTHIYTDSNCLPDGIWTLTYKLLVGGVMVTSYNVQIVVTGQVTIDNNLDFVYVPNSWSQSEMRISTFETMQLLEPLRKYTMRKAIETEPYQSNTAKILNSLEALTLMISNLNQ